MLFASVLKYQVYSVALPYHHSQISIFLLSLVVANQPMIPRARRTRQRQNRDKHLSGFNFSGKQGNYVDVVCTFACYPKNCLKTYTKFENIIAVSLSSNRLYFVWEYWVWLQRSGGRLNPNKWWHILTITIQPAMLWWGGGWYQLWSQK